MEKTYDECYFINYNSCTDLSLYEIGKQACPPSYSYGPVIRNHYIFHYLLAGSGTLNLNGKQYSIHARQGFIIPPNALAFYKADESNPWNYIWVHLDGPKTAEYFKQAGIDHEYPVFIPSRETDSITSIMNELLSNNQKELFCIGKIYELFDNLKSFSSRKPIAEPTTKLTYIKTIIDFIHIKYTEPIHMEDLCNACGLERSYMTKLFKEATGQTPQHYLTSYRMKKACEMLKNTSMSIQNIAYSVGYGDSFTFSKAFKRSLDTSPSDYRDSHCTTDY